MPSLIHTARLFVVLLWAVAASLPGFAQQGSEASQRRIALVIGNNAYESAPLANSVNDAQAMAGALREAGFAVTLLTDVDQRQFQIALREFGERLKAAGGGGAGLFYYAGHGVQIRGRNFLIPVRSNIINEDEVAYAAVDAQAVLDKMESAGNGTNIVILDACRNNPFMRSTRSTQQGLAQMDAPVGTLVAYATAPGSVAVDSRPGLRNGLYTAHLLEAVRQRGLKVEDVFKQVRNAVLRASGNKQQPWESTALVGDFYFHAPREGAVPTAMMPPPAPAAPLGNSQAAIDDALWDTVKDSRSSAEIFAYLNRFPAGRHAREARTRLLDLAQPGAGLGLNAGVVAGTGTGATPPAPAGVTFGAASRAVMASTPGAPVRVSAELIARWAPATGDKRPAQPRRNAAGFAEGDRFEYQKTDRTAGRTVTQYLWQIDRVADDGTLSVNGGRQRLDAHGQRQSGTDEHTGMWTEYSRPLPLQELVQRGPGATMPFSTTARVRHADLRVEEVSLSGELRASADTVVGLRGTSGPLPCIKIELDVEGTGRGVVTHIPNTSYRTLRLRWRHTYWMAPPLLVPVAFEIEEVADGQTRLSTRHELIAIDQLSLTEAAATAGSRR